MKKTITILISSLFFLFIANFYTIQAQVTVTTPPENIITPPENTGLPNPTDGIIGVLKGFVGWLLTIFLILAVLSFVITGIMYILAMGDGRSQNLENAKQNVKFSIIAVAVVGASYIIIQFIDDLLSAAL